MSLAEIKREILHLNAHDRQEVAALLHELSHDGNPEYLRGLEEEMARMDRGEKHRASEVLALHERLSAEGK